MLNILHLAFMKPLQFYKTKIIKVDFMINFEDEFLDRNLLDQTGLNQHDDIAFKYQN